MRKPTLMFGAFTLVLGILFIHLWRELHAARAQIALLSGSVEGLAAARPEPSADPVVQPVEPERSSGILAKSVVVPQVTVPATGKALERSGSLRERLKDPEYRALQRAQLRAVALRNYPDLAKELDLNEEDVSRLLDLQVDRDIEAMAGGPDAEASEEERKLALRTQQELSRQREAEVQQLLGTKYPQWREYRQSLGARQRIAQLRSVLASSAQPLSDAQASSLLGLLIADQQSSAMQVRAAGHPGDGLSQVNSMEQNLKQLEERNRRLFDAAASNLGSGQLGALRAMLDQELTMNRAYLRARRSQLDAGRSPPTIPASATP